MVGVHTRCPGEIGDLGCRVPIRLIRLHLASLLGPRQLLLATLQAADPEARIRLSKEPPRHYCQSCICRKREL